ncbi:MAG TPA: hypothetical protein VMK83_01520 [Gaiellaceae bacterium]|nr:hypothetical protein [Gaiellaceae bacterium]
MLDERGCELLLALRAMALAERGVGALLPAELEVDAHPLGVLLDDLPKRRLPALVHPEAKEALVVSPRQLEEEVVLGEEVVEDGAARQADLGLETRDRRAFVAVLRRNTGAGMSAGLPVYAYDEFDGSSWIAGLFYAALGA